MAVEIANLVHLMCTFAGATPDFPNGSATQAVGLRKIYKLDVGKYYLIPESPVLFDVQPPPALPSRPPVPSSLLIVEPLSVFSVNGFDVRGVFIPSDQPFPPQQAELAGAIYIEAIDVDGPTDNFLAQVLVLDYPTNGGARLDGVQIAGSPAPTP